MHFIVYYMPKRNTSDFEKIDLKKFLHFENQYFVGFVGIFF